MDKRKARLVHVSIDKYVITTSRSIFDDEKNIEITGNYRNDKKNESFYRCSSGTSSSVPCNYLLP